MPVHHALLALLDEGPSYGYELKATFEQAIGPQYGELNRGYVYQVLDRLERDGLVSRRSVAQTERPDKWVFKITPGGKDELRTWLDSSIPRQGGYRDDLFLKLFVAARRGVVQVRAVTGRQRVAYLGELATLGQLRSVHRGEPFVSLLVEAARLHTEAALAVVDLADSRASVIARSMRPSAHPGDAVDGPARRAGDGTAPHNTRGARPAIGE